MDIPDTKANSAEFGRPGSDTNPGPFPQVRVAGLCECENRAVVAARLAPFPAAASAT
jgi:hypothetical protein